ncbi:DMT family transporter [Nesterenkonia populi]
MRTKSSATHSVSAPLSGSERQGILWGLLGVAAFSLTVPLTRAAVEYDGLPPLFVGAARAVLAGALALMVLLMLRQRIPSPRLWPRIAVVAGGVVVGFPMLTSYSLTTSSAGHAAVIIALLPATTAMVAVIRTGERPPRAFWVATALGALAAGAFAAVHGGGFSSFGWPDALLLAAVVAGAFGYAEGGLLARELGAWQTICWALVMSLPVMALLTAVSVSAESPRAEPHQWLAFLYLGIISMFLGFFAWYRGLGIGPVSRVSQIQLIQPVMSLCWAALLLGERITWLTLLGGAAVLLCAVAAVRIRIQPASRK